MSLAPWTVYGAAGLRHKDGMTIDVKYVKRKQLVEFIDEQLVFPIGKVAKRKLEHHSSSASLVSEVGNANISQNSEVDPHQSLKRSRVMNLSRSDSHLLRQDDLDSSSNSSSNFIANTNCDILDAHILMTNENGVESGAGDKITNGMNGDSIQHGHNKYSPLSDVQPIHSLDLNVSFMEMGHSILI